MSLGGTSYLSYRSRCHGQTTAVGRPQAERGRSLSARGEYNPEPPTCSGTLTAVAPLRWPPNNTAAGHVRTEVSTRGVSVARSGAGFPGSSLESDPGFWGAVSI